MCRSITCAILSVFNTVLLVCGLAATIVGAILRWNQPLYEKYLRPIIEDQAKQMGEDAQKWADVAIKKIQEVAGPIGLVLFIFGLVIVCFAVLGYLGACCNIKICLIIYLIVLGALIAVHVILLIVYFSNRQTIIKYPSAEFEKLIYKYKSVSSQEADSLAVATIMPWFQCCGYYGGNDFRNSNASFTGKEVYQGNEISVDYPVPCCRFDNNNPIGPQACPVRFTSTNSYIDTGCKQPVEDKMIFVCDFVLKVSLVILIPLIIVFICGVIHLCLSD